MVIYVNTSVVIAHLLKEKRRPAVDFWNNWITSSSLLRY
jgi:hypothetical protein